MLHHMDAAQWVGALNPPLQGEGDRSKSGGGGVRQMPRPEVAAARQLRRTMTLPEVMLWEELRGAKIDVKFRRQHPIGPYVVDFFASSPRLAIEIDGIAHDSRVAGDVARDAFLRENGFDVMRFAATDVMKEMDLVLAAIVARVNAPLHRPAGGPPPRAGEDC
jgi:very-short-patch-repair endonuclease